MNKTITTLALSLLMLTTAGLSAGEQDSGFRFLATGDLPYSPDQDVRYRRLLKQSESEDFLFLMHVGDFKAQSAPCSDDEFRRIRDLFQAYPKPVVYTPGDNEWTDCDGVGVDPVERLDTLRDLFFRDPKTLRLDQMNVQPQSLDPKHSTYVENYRFSKSGVLFIVAHVVGSGNNYRADHPPSMKEFKSRNAANLAFMKESFAEAIAADAPGVAVVIHANPDFEKGNSEGFKGYRCNLWRHKRQGRFNCVIRSRFSGFGFTCSSSPIPQARNGPKPFVNARWNQFFTYRPFENSLNSIHAVIDHTT